MSLDLAERPAYEAEAPAYEAEAFAHVAERPVSVAERPAYVAVPLRVDGDPPSRPPARHRYRWSLRDLPGLADRLWRPPLGLAVAIFASCGPAHSLGHTDYVFNAVLVGLGLSGLALPLGVIGLRYGPHEQIETGTAPFPPAGTRE
ncbi:hypothetical protein [Couchioplanes azureus]|uniref:hypothetical protein n=1 Tax=Couchioplanes caeruleus TaxID=56438 RepID=UPI001670D736|nr:hypothetical protein [Couchioplanes caeruleus]GGQ73673.1 hypothetical protein GCM10010166_49770 [Couchioplanes caeruleus subsp. azureus]